MSVRQTLRAVILMTVALFPALALSAGVSYQFRGVNVVRVGGETHIAGTVGAEAASIPSAGSGSLWHLGTGALWQNGGTQVLGHAADFVSQHPIASTAGSAIVTAIRANAGALVTSAVAAFLLEKGLEYANGQWQKYNTTGTPPSPYPVYNSYLVQGPSVYVSSLSATSGPCVSQCQIFYSGCSAGPISYQGAGKWHVKVNRNGGDGDASCTAIGNGAVQGQTCPAGYTYDGSACRSVPVAAQESDWDAVRASTWPDPALRDLVRNGVSLPTDKPIYSPTSKDIDVSDPYTDPVTGNRYKDKARVTPSTAEPGKADVQIVKVQVDVNGNPVINPTTGQPETEKADPKDPCELNPNRVGCLDADTPDAPDINNNDKNISIVPQGGFGSDNATCPADKTYTLRLMGTITVSWEPICQLASGLRLIVIAMAWVSAILIAIGITKRYG